MGSLVKIFVVLGRIFMFVWCSGIVTAIGVRMRMDLEIDLDSIHLHT